FNAPAISSPLRPWILTENLGAGYSPPRIPPIRPGPLTFFGLLMGLLRWNRSIVAATSSENPRLSCRGTRRCYGAGGERWQLRRLDLTDGVPRCPSRTT